jgi:hypothetical protein
MSDKTLKIRIKLQPAETSTVSLESPPKVYKEKVGKPTHTKSKRRWYIGTIAFLSGAFVFLIAGYLIFSGEKGKTPLAKLPPANSNVSAAHESIQTEVEIQTTTSDEPSIIALQDVNDPIYVKSELPSNPQQETAENVHQPVSSEQDYFKEDPELEDIFTITAFDSPVSSEDIYESNPSHNTAEQSPTTDNTELSNHEVVDFDTTFNQDRSEAHDSNISSSHIDSNSSSSTASLPSHIARAQFTNGIKNREPIDHLENRVHSEEQTSKRLFYFTDLRDLKGEKVTHRWKHKGNTMAKVNFNVGGARWRVYSSKNLTPSLKGEWQIVVTDSAERILITDNITYD